MEKGLFGEQFRLSRKKKQAFFAQNFRVAWNLLRQKKMSPAKCLQPNKRKVGFCAKIMHAYMYGSHSHSPTYVTAFESQSGELYCARCRNYVQTCGQKAELSLPAKLRPFQQCGCCHHKNGAVTKVTIFSKQPSLLRVL